MTRSLSELSRGALAELADVFARLPEDSADALVEAIVAARKIVLFGCGREGLQMRGLAMRLFHLGRDVTVWGDMSMPPIGSLFETAEMIFFELVILKLRPRFGETPQSMRARHTNLE